MQRAWVLVLSAVLACATCTAAADAGSDASAPPASASPPQKFYVEDIKLAMTTHIAENLDANGTFHLRDDRTGELLALKFVKIHDPVRRIDDGTYFACTDFQVAGEPDKLYDLDFWMKPQSGKLKIYDTRVHKEPRWSLIYGWYKQPRYTFVDDRVVSLY